MATVGVLTSGGDCPGLNAVIRALVRRCERRWGDDIVGFLDGWAGVVEGRHVPLDVEAMRGTLTRGGTVLGTSRRHPWMSDDGPGRARATIDGLGLDALVVVGGEGSLAVAHRAHREGLVSVVGVPKTIDNDVPCTEQTFGFDTAVGVATEAIDRLHTTAESHDRVMVVEVMGRHVGHIATWAGIAGGATVTLVPEHPFDIAAVAEVVRRRHDRGRFASIVVVAEGARPVPGTMEVAEPVIDRFGHEVLGGIGSVVADELAQRTGFETRVTVLGHVQRGGTPSAYDRVLSSRYGVAAADAVHEGGLGSMVALQEGAITTVPLSEVVGHLKTVDPRLWDTANTLFEARLDD
ncbi:MAG: 6-phosphofructokinase [Acidimicrobiaceae bacterium]|nr:6-phosphofructokinase [Acidimicrobiaceae bacterium]